MLKSLSPVCFITPDGKDAETVGAMVLTALEAGIRWVQFRRKTGTRRQLYYEARNFRELAERFSAFFIVNDYADIALAVDADGLHIGQDDLPLREARKVMGEKIVGVSTHSLEQAVEAQNGGADYIGFGPIYFTDTKDAGSPKGPESLVAIKQAVKVPVVAIGGITSGNVGEVFRAGCDAVAVSSGICRDDITANVAGLLYNICH